MDELDIEGVGLVRSVLLGLTDGCPLGDDIRGCPIQERQRMSCADSFEWVRSLSVDELSELYLTHRECLKAREAACAPGQPFNHGAEAAAAAGAGFPLQQK